MSTLGLSDTPLLDAAGFKGKRVARQASVPLLTLGT
jgi:hypothetical protein